MGEGVGKSNSVYPGSDNVDPNQASWPPTHQQAAVTACPHPAPLPLPRQAPPTLDRHRPQPPPGSRAALRLCMCSTTLPLYSPCSRTIC